MDRIHFQVALFHSQAHREKRYTKHNIARKKLRVRGKKFNCYDLIATTPRTPSIVEVNDRSIAEDHENLCGLCDNDDDCQSIEKREESQNEFPPAFADDANDCRNSTISTDTHDSIHITLSEDEISSPVKVPLHDYTSNSTYDYCQAFTIIARQANLSKTSTNELLSLIKSGLPTPNQLPPTEEALLLLLGVEDLFIKRSICLACLHELDLNEKICSLCRSTDKNLIACV